jgi:hypothetical protein
MHSGIGSEVAGGDARPSEGIAELSVLHRIRQGAPRGHPVLCLPALPCLGYTIGRCYSTKTGKAYVGPRPSKKRITRLCRAIREETRRRWTLLESHDRVAKLNRMSSGWANYFCLGPVSKAYRTVDAYARHRLRQWLCAKHKVKGEGTTHFPDEYLDRTLGLIRLQSRPRNFPWANA